MLSLIHKSQDMKFIRRRFHCRKYFSLLYICICISLFLLMNILVIWDHTYPCITPAESRTKLIYMVKAFSEIMTELNITHWIDYGTLLGALRYETIAIWDYDADVSFERTYAKLLHNRGPAQKIAKERYNIYLNAAVMVYEGMIADVFSWKKQKSSDGSYIYTKAVHRSLTLIESQFHDFNASFIEKTVLIPFAGGLVRAPHPPMEFIKRRYPTSYNRLVPFKVSCYFPWNIPYWFIFNQPMHKIT